MAWDIVERLAEAIVDVTEATAVVETAISSLTAFMTTDAIEPSRIGIGAKNVGGWLWYLWWMRDGADWIRDVRK